VFTADLLWLLVLLFLTKMLNRWLVYRFRFSIAFGIQIDPRIDPMYGPAVPALSSEVRRPDDDAVAQPAAIPC
jgi:hypothetical protein